MKYQENSKLTGLYSLFGQPFVEETRIIISKIIDNYNHFNKLKHYPELKELKRKNKIDIISFSDFTTGYLGGSLFHCIKRIKGKTKIKGKKVLLIGIGKGDEVHAWMKEKPTKLTCIDYLYFKEWKALKKLYSNIELIKGDYNKIKLKDKYDIVAGKALLEHIRDIEKGDNFSNLIKYLKKGGVFWQDFGGLWHVRNGPHCQCNYDHLLNKKSFEKNKFKYKTIELHKDYIKHDLFSRLKFKEYISLFEKYFNKKYLAINIGETNLGFKKENPSKWKKLRQKYKEQDLIISFIYFLGVKK